VALLLLFFAILLGVFSRDEFPQSVTHRIGHSGNLSLAVFFLTDFSSPRHDGLAAYMRESFATPPFPIEYYWVNWSTYSRPSEHVLYPPAI
jgi:hypothetical protein